MLAISSEHLAFFKAHGYIAFHHLLLETSAKELKIHLEKALAERLGTSVEKLSRKPNCELFTSAYDLHLVDDTIRKTSHKPRIANVAQQLFDQPLLRFGFSQYLMTSSDPTPPFSDPFSFEKQSCLTPLAGLLLLNLGEVHGLLASFSFPQELGSALFISPSLPFPWQEIFQMPHTHLFLIAFAQNKTFFRADTPDPLSLELKKLGYAYNDLIKEPLHPLLGKRS